MLKGLNKFKASCIIRRILYMILLIYYSQFNLCFFEYIVKDK